MPRNEDKVPATLRAIGVLEALVAESSSAELGKLAQEAHLPKPTAYRMLAMPARRGRDGANLFELTRRRIMMSEDGEKIEIHRGLKGVVFDRSRVCDIDGRAGELYYRGYSIHDLAERSSSSRTIS